MLFLGLALLTAVLGVLPLLIFRKVVAGVVTALGATLVFWWLYYLMTPSLAWPLLGLIGFFVLVLWFLSAVIHGVIEEEFPMSAFFFIVGAVVYLVVGISGSGLFRASDYAGIIGNVEQRVWTEDVQPAEPRHIRLVPLELAIWLANKQLGEAPGAIGSQFQISNEHMTLQMIRGELWYVAPLDFKGFAVWSSTKAAPGYVMVHGQDPLRPVIVKTGESFRYMPGAFFGSNLERHLWNEGYRSYVLTDYTFEIDEAGKAWWVVTVYKPTIAWSGEKVLGVAVINPTDGSHTLYPLGKVPNWIDRVVPKSFVANYIEWRGEYANGWWNSFWAQKDITEPEEPNIVYGSDGEPYWVTGVTSSNRKDQALVGLMYTHTRTGRSVFYRASGGTDKAVIQAVNNAVSYRRWHATSPILYNIYGTMAAIVPVLGESHTFQGVAIVKLDNLQVAVGEDQYVALREYQKAFSLSGQQIAPEAIKERSRIVGVVDRFAAEFKGKDTMYYLHIAGTDRLFTGASELSPKLPLTRVGDKVELTFIASGEDVQPLLAFDNHSLPLAATQAQKYVREKAAERKAEAEKGKEGRSARDQLQNMNDEELKELLKLKKQNEQVR